MSTARVRFGGGSLSKADVFAEIEKLKPTVKVAIAHRLQLMRGALDYSSEPDASANELRFRLDDRFVCLCIEIDRINRLLVAVDTKKSAAIYVIGANATGNCAHHELRSRACAVFNLSNPIIDYYPAGISDAKISASGADQRARIRRVY